MSKLASGAGAVPEQLINGRYQTVEVLSSEKWGQTYSALDTQQVGNPKCVIKQFRPWVSDAAGRKAARDLFDKEVEMLEALSQHEQIARLVHHQEVDESFYLVREFIIGHPLSAELSTQERWSESKVIHLLQEVLDLLRLVHQQGAIHCNLHPDNLIRRESDGKLVLMDFGGIKQIQTPLVGIQFSPVVWLDAAEGYIPPEQILGSPHPNSDIYALGLIAIQALTGLKPAQFSKKLQTGDVDWQGQAAVSSNLAAILTQMIRYDFKNRYQSASEVLDTLQPVASANAKKEAEKLDLALAAAEQVADSSSAIAPNGKFNEKHLRAVGVTTSLALALGAGSYLLLKSANSLKQSDPGEVTLAQASQKYQDGDFQQALALAQSVSPESQAYPEAQTALSQWQKDWKAAQAKESAVKTAFAQQQWRDVLAKADALPDIDFWQQRVAPMVKQATANLEEEAYQLLQQAYNQAVAKDFAGALNTFKQIPQGTKAYALVKEKTVEYSEKLNVRSSYWLQQAYNQAASKDFTGALAHLRKIPKGTPSYAIAQQKIAEYSQKENIRANSLLQKAYDQAGAKNYASAIVYLKQISQDTQAFTKAQAKLADYTQKLRSQGA